MLGAGNRYKGDQSCHQLSFGFPSNTAAPDGMHSPIFCLHMDRDGCSLPKWQNHHSYFTTAIAWWTSGRTTLRAHQVSTGQHQAKWASQPKRPWRRVLRVQPGLIVHSHSRVELSKYFEQLLISKAALHQLSISVFRIWSP